MRSQKTSYPAIDKSDFKPNFSKQDSNDQIDLGWGEGVFSDGRPYRIEFWAQYQLSMLTYFFSSIDMEKLSPAEIKKYLMDEHVVSFDDDAYNSAGYEGINMSSEKFIDKSGNQMWAVNILLGIEDGAIFIKECSNIRPYDKKKD